MAGGEEGENWEGREEVTGERESYYDDQNIKFHCDSKIEPDCIKELEYFYKEAAVICKKF